MTESLLPRVQNAFHDAFDVDAQFVSMNTAPEDIPGWDSVGHLTLATRLESAFDVSFDVDDLMEMENVREIVRIVDSKLKSRVNIA
jgi:acyl carrier protein